MSAEVDLAQLRAAADRIGEIVEKGGWAAGPETAVLLCCWQRTLRDAAEFLGAYDAGQPVRSLSA